MFKEDWLYLTFLSPVGDTSIKLVANFTNSKIQKKKKQPFKFEEGIISDNIDDKDEPVYRYRGGFDIEMLEDIINEKNCTSKDKIFKLRAFALKVREDEGLLEKFKNMEYEIKQ